MYVKPKSLFASTRTGTRIRVNKVYRSISGHIYDDCEVVTLSRSGRAIKSTTRLIFADSIRRNYLSAQFY